MRAPIPALDFVSLVDVEGVAPDVDELHLRLAQPKGICSRDKSVGWHNDFIAGGEITQESSGFGEPEVQDVVSWTLTAPNRCCMSASQRCANGPSPEILRDCSASSRYSRSRPVRYGRLKGMLPLSVSLRCIVPAVLPARDGKAASRRRAATGPCRSMPHRPAWRQNTMCLPREISPIRSRPLRNPPSNGAASQAATRIAPATAWSRTNCNAGCQSRRRGSFADNWRRV